ncbi:hypothetical protein GWO13_00855 [Candidatus Bathyarchaeota archaeon]|nr:hypothetical protein [Candidatus Bathyarchaeota archaeon]
MIPEFPRLRGEEAIRALFVLIHELEEQGGKELTDKQTTALIKIAKGLIFSIEEEMRLGTSDKKTKGMHFMTHFKKTIAKHIPEPVRALFLR